MSDRQDWSDNIGCAIVIAACILAAAAYEIAKLFSGSHP